MNEQGEKYEPGPPIDSDIGRALASMQDSIAAQRNRLDATALDLSDMRHDLAEMRDLLTHLVRRLDAQREEVDQRTSAGRPVLSILVGLLAAAVALAVTIYLFSR